MTIRRYREARAIASEISEMSVDRIETDSIAITKTLGNVCNLDATGCSRT